MVVLGVTGYTGAMKTLNGNLELLEGLEAIKELVRQRLRFKRGESFLDRTAGRISLATLPSSLWPAVIADTIRGVQGVIGVRNVSAERDENTGLVKCTAIVESAEGTFSLTDEIEP